MALGLYKVATQDSEQSADSTSVQDMNVVVVPIAPVPRDNLTVATDPLLPPN